MSFLIGVKKGLLDLIYCNDFFAQKYKILNDNEIIDYIKNIFIIYKK